MKILTKKQNLKRWLLIQHDVWIDQIWVSHEFVENNRNISIKIKEKEGMKMFNRKQKVKKKMLIQNKIGIDQLGITHSFAVDNINRIIELYKISDAITRRKY